MTFYSRYTAGQALAEALKSFDQSNALVVALPPGGAIVGSEVAKTLHLPFDVIVARPLKTVDQQLIGAIAPNGVHLVIQEAAEALHLSEDDIRSLIGQAHADLERRLLRYRSDRPMPTVQGKTVFFVVEGLEEGLLEWAAIRALQKLQPQQIILATPVSSPEALDLLQPEVDDTVILDDPKTFNGVADAYQTYKEVNDQEVIDVLNAVTH